MICILLTYALFTRLHFWHIFCAEMRPKDLQICTLQFAYKNSGVKNCNMDWIWKYVSMCKIKLLQRCKQTNAGHNFSSNNQIYAEPSFFYLRLQFWHGSLTRWVLQAWGEGGSTTFL